MWATVKYTHFSAWYLIHYYYINFSAKDVCFGEVNRMSNNEKKSCRQIPS